MWGLSLYTAIMLIVLGVAIGMYITLKNKIKQWWKDHLIDELDPNDKNF